ncbi:MAG: MbcA/ParS/Xre antitoxin family protein [Gammaproteobacteria bacterium]
MSFTSPENQVEITRQIMRILDEWELSGKDIIKLLGLPSKTRLRYLDRFRDGEAFPASQTTYERIEHIAGIADALRTSFPRNAHMGILWMHTPHRRFQNQPPLTLLSEQGLNGLRMVRSELDCAFSWEDTLQTKN